ncbi:M20 peptidase aminoacylase family protein [Cytobacillus kochii]|uniref:M20 peptidase aminoacylase family protein n=1 Tax=Cytobacillus kochii TaxID=859143 RepID=UPI002041AD1B|nr:M20 peptidase aminoacylase family protein [Cytobacillus kochii]MCM3321182.1 M20 peptidase aminoacylase family protein [Cytobacillus kochii]MCM3343985.1 M20 peptidase aminoacylase family protein [Cytobacillus kochii]MDM5207832.1 M20 peptidase aminoacylase family protein [Cytobacillus kochii]
MKELQELEALKPKLTNIFNHLHQNPEISWQETKTTTFIAEVLKKEGILFQTLPKTTGLIAEIGSGEKAIGVRTDIDALWQEVDGVMQANHSCGHDAHMTMAIGTLLVLHRLNAQKKGRVKFLFQPAEEKGTGALKFIEEGLIDDLNYLYGVHVRPIQELRDGQCSPAIMHGAGRFVTGEIIGEDAHGARPHLGQSAIEIGAAIVQELNRVKLDPMVPHSVKMTKFQAGGDSSNIIPGKAHFSLDLRAQTNEVMQQLATKVEAIFAHISSLHEVEIHYKTTADIAAAQVDTDAVQIMGQAIVETIGKEKMVPPIITSGGEDFHFYTLKRPELKATMLGLGCGLTPGLHHPKMNFNHEAIFTGIEILVKTVLNTLEKEGA